MDSLREAIAASKRELTVAIADTPELIREAHRLRYQVYCVEHNYETGRCGLEFDEFDVRSRHIIVYRQRSGDVLGTVRLILPEPRAINNSFPIQRVCDPRLLRRIPLHDTGEVSRFAVSKHWRVSSGAANRGLRLALIKGAIRLSAEAGHTHWLAVMEPSLIRLLRTSGVHFDPLGPQIEYHGIRQPAFANLGKLLRTLAEEFYEFWDFATDGGRVYGAPEQLLAA